MYLAYLLMVLGLKLVNNYMFCKTCKTRSVIMEIMNCAIMQLCKMLIMNYIIDIYLELCNCGRIMHIDMICKVCRGRH
jgi:hypothetical protein